jgi:hypothetical protein
MDRFSFEADPVAHWPCYCLWVGTRHNGSTQPILILTGGLLWGSRSPGKRAADGREEVRGTNGWLAFTVEVLKVVADVSVRPSSSSRTTPATCGLQ